jgi:hypothetical protein
VRRIPRHLFTIVSALSLLLCVAACGLWVRSYWRIDVVRLPDGSDQLKNTHGLLEIDHSSIRRWTGTQYESLPESEWSAWAVWSWKSDGQDGPFSARIYHFAGFAHMWWTQQSGFADRWRFTVITIPWWFLCVSSAALPAWQFLNRSRRRRRQWRIAHNLCANCGYDIRATPERCPECGTARVNDQGPMSTPASGFP